MWKEKQRELAVIRSNEFEGNPLSAGQSAREAFAVYFDAVGAVLCCAGNFNQGFIPLGMRSTVAGLGVECICLGNLQMKS
jgi:hypothetical protein